jgi:2-polyprenyl-3-methyl-5-hydroxy-6-metoxy-1,4-benzoquinol methylase
MDQIAISNKIDEVIKQLTDLKNSINEPKVATLSTPAAMPQATEDTDDSFESLKTILYSDKWPVAVNPNLICDLNSEEDKKERGIGILELVIEDDIKGKKFLDFGCGEGHCAASAVEILGCSFSVGYDTKQFNWPEVQNTKFTTTYDDVVAAGPYDAILLFDVIDHADGESPESILNKVRNVLAPDGKIYIRCHPWMSRHATHLYHKINKAYAHLVFTEDELNQLSDHVADPNIKITHPFANYGDLFKNLKIITRREITENVDPFFKIPKIANRIIKNTEKHKTFPEFQMGLSFIDYVLTNQ